MASTLPPALDYAAAGVFHRAPPRHLIDRSLRARALSARDPENGDPSASGQAETARGRGQHDAGSDDAERFGSRFASLAPSRSDDAFPGARSNADADGTAPASRVAGAPPL